MPEPGYTMTLVIFGEVGSGKTTLLNHMAVHFGSIPKDKVQKESDDTRGEALVWLGDTTEEEGWRCSTGWNTFSYINTPRGLTHTIDTPSDPDHTADLTAALAMADCAILLLDGRQADSNPYMFCPDETRRLIKMAAAMGVTQLISAVNYMNEIIDQEEAMDRMRTVIGNVCRNNGFDDETVIWIPVSGKYGFSVFPECYGFDFFQGYEKDTPRGRVQGRTLVEAIEHTVLDDMDNTRPPRVHILGTWKTLEGHITALGRVASGHISTGSWVMIPPHHQGAARVASIADKSATGTPCQRAATHGIYKFTFDDVVDVRVGSVITEAGADTPGAIASFDAKVVMTSREADFTDGCTFDVYIHAACVACRVEVLSAARGNGPVVEKPGSMRFRQKGTVRFTPLEPLVVEAQDQQRPKSMYRFMIGKDNEVLGAGIVKSCAYEMQDDLESWIVV